MNKKGTKPMPLGDKIKAVRENAGMSLTALAQNVGISKGYLSQIESGSVKNPAAVIVGRIARVLKTTSEMLLNGELTLPEKRSKKLYEGTDSEHERLKKFLCDIREKGTP